MTAGSLFNLFESESLIRVLIKLKKIINTDHFAGYISHITTTDVRCDQSVFP